jgi:hypothetical protein
MLYGGGRARYTARMRRWRGCALTLLLALTIVAAACGDPPDKEMQQAQGAIDAARAAGADVYAHDEFAAAEAALKSSQDAVQQRDYRLALNHALDSRERAQEAAKAAADRKASARVDADRAITAAATAIEQAHARLKAAETARAAARSLAEPRRAIAAADAALQKAREAFAAGDYLEIPGPLTPVTARLQAAVRDLDALASGAARRHR